MINESSTAKGFTLAETLITLVVVGVIAAITVPSLIAKYRADQFASRLKASYSRLGQLVNQMNMQEMRLTTDENYESYTLFPVMVKYLNNVKSIRSLNYTNVLKEYKNYTNTDLINTLYFDEGMVVLTDGTTLFIQNFNGTRVMLSIDLNGHLKKPNQLGRDLFMFEVLPNGNLVPMGVPGTTYSEGTFCTEDGNSQLNGAGCTVKALKDKDYFKKIF